jgi:hypothetical protein
VLHRTSTRPTVQKTEGILATTSCKRDLTVHFVLTTDINQWEAVSAQVWIPRYTFPDPDLIASLTDIFFSHVHPYYPIIHQPTFRKSVNEGLHFQNHQFGATVLLVCAVASRWSDDTRVLVEGSNSRLSSGFHWYDQVQLLRKDLYQVPSLYELQFYCVSSMVQFLTGLSRTEM